MIGKVFVLILVVVLFALIAGCAAQRHDGRISLKQAKEIGKKYLEAHPDFEDVYFSVAHFSNDVDWIDLISDDLFIQNILKENDIGDREYWAIYYGQKAADLGGTAYVLIDAKTGEVIAFMGGI